MVVRKCANCGRMYETGGYVYCSEACREIANGRKARARKNAGRVQAGTAGRQTYLKNARNVYLPDQERRRELEELRHGFRAPRSERDHVINSTIRVTKRGDH